MRHIQTQCLWLQEAHATKRLHFEKIDGSRNPSDLLTKHLSEILMDRHMKVIGALPEDGRASTAPTLASLGINQQPLLGFTDPGDEVTNTSGQLPNTESSKPCMRQERARQVPHQDRTTPGERTIARPGAVREEVHLSPCHTPATTASSRRATGRRLAQVATPVEETCPGVEEETTRRMGHRVQLSLPRDGTRDPAFPEFQGCLLYTSPSPRDY